MYSYERTVLDTLLELERTAVLARTAQPKPNILPILEKLDRLAESLPDDAPADLRHYLQRKSYEKARLFLLGRDAENQSGQCGH
jgi:hypothetical protein